MPWSAQSMQGENRGGQKWTFDLLPRQWMQGDHTLDLSKALKNQGTETTSIWILKKRKGSRLTRTCRWRLLNRDNTSSIFRRCTNGWMNGWMVIESMHVSRESKGCKDERLQQRQMLEAKWVTEANAWRKKHESWDWDVSYLFQPLHVFEVESNIKKAEIRIYKLKLQDKERPHVTGKNGMVFFLNKLLNHSNSLNMI